MESATNDVVVPARSASRALRVSLWIIQVLLGAFFLMAGFAHATQPLAVLATQYPWTSSVAVGLLRFIGIAEILGGFGIVLPSLTRIAPALTPLAAAALVALMMLATIFHTMRGELVALPFTLTVAALSAFVAWGRFKRAPISTRKG